MLILGPWTQQLPHTDPRNHRHTHTLLRSSEPRGWPPPPRSTDRTPGRKQGSLTPGSNYHPPEGGDRGPVGSIHLLPPAQGIDGGPVKEHRLRAPAPSWWDLGGRGCRAARGGDPGSSGGGGQLASEGSEAPSQGLPQGQRDSLAPGRGHCPHTEKGALTQPSRARRAAGARQLASGRGRGGGCPGQGVQGQPARRGGTRFPGQQLTSQPAVHGPLCCFHPLPPQARPRLPPPLSPGLAPSWALGARVTVSGLAGPRPGLCQLARAAATSHYLARPAGEGYRDPGPANRRPPGQRAGAARKHRPCQEQAGAHSRGPGRAPCPGTLTPSTRLPGGPPSHRPHKGKRHLGWLELAEPGEGLLLLQAPSLRGPGWGGALGRAGAISTQCREVCLPASGLRGRSLELFIRPSTQSTGGGHKGPCGSALFHLSLCHPQRQTQAP